MAVKAMRYQIVKPISLDWKVAGKILRDARYGTRQIMNKTIQYCWEWQCYAQDYKAANGVYPKAKEIISYADMRGYSYNKLKDMYPGINSANLSQTITLAVQRWKTDLEEVLKGNKSIANYKKNMCIYIAGKNLSLHKVGEDIILKCSVLSNQKKKELGLSTCAIDFIINPGHNSALQIIKRCLDGTYRTVCSKIDYR